MTRAYTTEIIFQRLGAAEGAVMKRAGLFAALLLVASVGATLEPASSAPTGRASHIVTVREGLSAEEVAARHGVSPTQVYELVGGFAATLTNREIASLSRDPDIVDIASNRQVRRRPPQPPQRRAPSSQVVTTDAQRVGLLQSPTAQVDGFHQPLNVGIAVMDTGLDRRHPDLNVGDGHSCIPGERWFDDPSGHGTETAGVAAARDNGIGIVGIAPGARLFGVKMFSRSGDSSLENVLCSIEWILRNSGRIDVVNMGWLQDEANAQERAIVRRAIRSLLEAGVVVVAPAGNESQDVGNGIPAGYPEVITVSGMADRDGLPGGHGGPLSEACYNEQDDTFAFFSNYGSVIDISAPAVCVTTTEPGNQYVAVSGTSFAAPHVAGAAALLKSRHRDWSPRRIQDHIKATAEPGPIPEDPDSFPEGILNVAGY